MTEMTTGRRSDSKATRDFWARINREDRAADARGNGRPLCACPACSCSRPVADTPTAGYGSWCGACALGDHELSELEKRWLDGDR